MASPEESSMVLLTMAAHARCGSNVKEKARAVSLLGDIATGVLEANNSLTTAKDLESVVVSGEEPQKSPFKWEFLMAVCCGYLLS
jgi:hypothetical protein